MMKRTFGLVTFAAIVVLSAAGAHPLAAQEEECELERSDQATRAQSLIAEAREAETPEEATEKYEEAVAAVGGGIDSEDAVALLMAAMAQVGLGEYEAADALLDRFLELKPGCQEPAHNTRYNAWVELYNEAITAYQAGDSERALDRFETANVILEDVRSLNNAAFLHQQQGDTDAAIELYRRATRANGDQEQVRSAMSSLADLLAAAGRTEEAVEIYGPYLEEHPDDMVMRIQYALALTDAGRTEEAAPIFEEVLQAEGLSNPQWNHVGVGLFNAEQYEKAVQAFRKAHEANPFNKEALENLVASLVQANTSQEAVDLAPQLIERYPYDEANYQLAANVLASVDRDREALQLMQQGEDAPLSFQSVQLTGNESGYVIRGIVEGRESGAGKTMAIPFELVGPDGSVVAARELEVQVPPAGQTSNFELSVETAEDVAGFRYHKAGGEGG